MTLPKHMDLKTYQKRIQQRTNLQTTKQAESSKLEIFKSKPFWINDPIKHEIVYNKQLGYCCFNHIIGLPQKNGKDQKIFDYEIEITKYLELTKNLWIKKARGLGLTEFFLRYLVWLCLFSNKYQGQRAHIITGPRIELAEEEIRRIKSLLQPKFKIFTNNKDTAEINGVTIQSFPSNALSMRGYDNVFWIMLDEADFFPPHQQQEARAAAEGYRIKSNPWIIMISTPNKRGGIYETIELAPEEEHGYKKLEYLYERGLGKIYDPQEIEREKTKPYFKREYCGYYDIDTGNLFTTTTLDEIESLGRKLSDFETVNPATYKSLGIDVGYGSSKTAFTVTEHVDGYVRVIHSNAFTRPVVEEMVNYAVGLIFHYRLNRYGNQVYVDAANPGFIRSLKIAIGESPDYETTIENMRRGFDNKRLPLEGTMTVIPMAFNIHGEPMLERLKKLGDNGQLAINADVFPDLMSDLRTARVTGLKLEKDKAAGQQMDLLDSLRLALEFYQTRLPTQ